MRSDEIGVGGANPDVGRRRSVVWAVAGLAAAGGAAPVLLYWLLFGWIATVTPGEATRMLRQPTSTAVLVDVRDPEIFAAGHIDGAVNWPLAKILAANSSADVPPPLEGRSLLLICDVGMASRMAAWRLGVLGVPRALNVRGGIQEWMRSFAQQINSRRRPAPTDLSQILQKTDPPQGGLFNRWRTGPERVEEFPFRVSSLGEQAAAVLAYFLIKPVYTLLSLAVAVVLWKRREPDLAALRWSMISFFLGENACAINYGFFRETSYLFEYLHSFGMLCAFGFFAYAVLEAIDRRILMLSAPEQRCAALGLCTRCIKYADAPCGLKRMFLLLIPLLILVALMVPTADWQDRSYNTYIFGQLYHYAHLRVFQQFENWYCPLAAVLCLTASLAFLASTRQEAIARAKIPFAAGVGALGFGMFRMILGGAYDQHRVWYLFWEEGTELLFMVAICVGLWIFQRGLFSTRADTPAP